MSLIHVNDPVWVKLTPEGLAILKARLDKLKARVPTVEDWTPPKTDEQGYSRHLLWELFAAFGSSVHIGMIPPFGAEIHFTDPALDKASDAEPTRKPA